MARETQPLLQGERPSSQYSNDRADAEDEAIFNTQKSLAKANKHAKWREIGLFAWAVLATAALIVLAVFSQHQQTTSSHGNGKKKFPGKRNLIFMVSDGMGPASLSLTRSFRQFEEGLPIDDVLNLDHHLIGQSRTRSSSSLITDSAAGATAFSCGLKSYNGAISMLPDHMPCGTVRTYFLTLCSGG